MPTVTGPLVALTAAGLGNLAGITLAVAGEGGGGLDVAPWLQGGGSAAAVAGLVYVARMIVKGDLVPRAVAERENETTAAIAAQARREAAQVELVNEAHAREVVLANLANSVSTMLGRVSQQLDYWESERRGRRSRGEPTT